MKAEWSILELFFVVGNLKAMTYGELQIMNLVTTGSYDWDLMSVYLLGWMRDLILLLIHQVLKILITENIKRSS
jgi:hypothetical protein